MTRPQTLPPPPPSPKRPARRLARTLWLLSACSALVAASECRTQSGVEEGSAVASASFVKVVDETPVDPAPGPAPQVEPHVAVDPRDPSRLVAAWMSVSSGPWEVRLARSTDGGRNWSRVPSPVAADAFRSFDPWLAWAPDGSSLYLALIEVLSGASGGEEWRLPVFRSEDGGESWSRWGEVPGETLDRPVLLAERGAVYVLASEAVASAPIVVAWSDAGESAAFEEVGRYLPAGELSILSAAALTVDGRGDRDLVLSFTDRTSLQDGRPRPLGAVPFTEVSRSFGQVREVGKALFVGAPQLAVDSFPGSPWRGRIYSVWAGRGGGGAAALRVAVSEDGGASWHERASLPAADGTSFVTVPAAAVDRRGRLGVTWREHTGDLATGCSTVHFALSLDGGVTFSIRRQVSSEPSCPDRPENRIDLSGIPLLRRWPGGGDYAGLAVGGDGVFHPVWGDAREGSWRIRTARIEVGPGG